MDELELYREYVKSMLEIDDLTNIINYTEFVESLTADDIN